MTPMAATSKNLPAKLPAHLDSITVLIPPFYSSRYKKSNKIKFSQKSAEIKCGDGRVCVSLAIYTEKSLSQKSLSLSRLFFQRGVKIQEPSRTD